MTREEILTEVYGDATARPTPANSTLPRGPGPQSLGEDEDREEFRALIEASRDVERWQADEQGMQVAEYREFLAAEKVKDDERTAYWASGQGKRDWDAEQSRMRRQIGLPDGVLPRAILCTANGSIGIMMPGDKRPHYGPFTVDAAGNLVRQ